MKKTKRTREEVLEDIKKLAQKLNKTPTRVELHKEYGYKVRQYSSYIEELGLSLNKNKLSKEIIISKIEDYMKINNKYPSYKELIKIIDSKSIRKYFGSLKILHDFFEKRESIKELDFSKKELIEYLQSEIDNNNLLSTNYFKQKGKISFLTVLKRLECRTWEEVLNLINRKEMLKEKIVYIKNKIKEDYINLSKDLNKENGASMKDISKYTSYKVKEIIFLFGGMRGLRKETGFENIYNKEKLDYNLIKNKMLEIYKKKGKMTTKEIMAVLKKEELCSLNTVKVAFKVQNLTELYKEIEKGL